MTLNVLWYSTRGAGIVSLILFTAVVCLGIVAAVGWHRPGWPRFMSQAVHRTLALTSLIFLGIHIVTAIVDPYTALGLAAAAIPFASSYRPLWVGLGSVAMYLVAALIVSSLVRDRIGLRTWRAIHWTAYAFWPLALVHGFGAGTDSGALWMLAIQAACVVAVIVAVAWRLVDATSRHPLVAYVPARLRLADSRMLNPAGFPGGPRAEVGVSGVGRIDRADRLLAGPMPAAGPERQIDHRARLGPLPRADAALIPMLEAAGIEGRGGAGFSMGKKWRSIAERADGHAVVLANGAEGKPTSRKDGVLMAIRPHLVLDGAELAADAVGAEEIVIYVGTDHRAAISALGQAIEERRSTFRVPVELIEAPHGYVAGEASAAVHYVNDRDARPTGSPRPYEAGVRGQPTLVQNVESLAYAALVARYGDAWYRTAGRASTPGTALVTVSGSTDTQRVVEIEYGTTVREVLDRVGGVARAGQAVLLGDSFGAWADISGAWDLPLDPAVMRQEGMAFGAGVVSVVPVGTCGVVQAAGIMAFMAGESAAQCGPCVFGLRSLADATARVAAGRAQSEDLERISRWGGQLAGRGACRHPDGAAAFLGSALRVFGDEFARHAAGRACSMSAQASA